MWEGDDNTRSNAPVNRVDPASTIQRLTVLIFFDEVLYEQALHSTRF